MTAKILLWDLETTNFDPEMGNMLTFAYGWLNPKTGHCPAKLLRINDYKGWEENPTNDYELVKNAKEILEQADLWVTWFGMWFDVRFMTTRVMYWSEVGAEDWGYQPLGYLPQPPDQQNHIDLWWHTKRRLSLRSNRLDAVQQFLGKHARKTRLKKQIWKDAAWGHEESLEYVHKHGLMDIKVLKGAYESVMPYVSTYNHILQEGGEGMCPRCGKTYLRVENRGYVRTRTGKKQRLCYFHADGKNHWATTGVSAGIKKDIGR